MTSKRPAYASSHPSHEPNHSAIQAASPGFSPPPDTPTAYYSPLSTAHPLILPTIPQRRKSKPNTTTTTTSTANFNNFNNTNNPNKRRKSSYPAHQHQLRDDGIEGYEQPAASPAYQPLNTLTEQQQQKEDGELENDPEEEENRKELNDDDYTVRKREDLLNKDRLKILLEHFDPQQMDRYSEYRNSGLAKANVRKLANSILQQSVSERVTIVIRGFAKVFVGHMVEQALEVQKRRGGTGPIAQHDLKEAYRAYLSERDRGGSDRRKMFTK
ncbi:hypothetical protein PtA15_5A92 [Puccinia triticina]|uniref:TAFII28-like protein domain-containing protein n=1 Tax=Puccinia triticina TaxID=208348 RepID=A0ABY7CP22_9BASI|nr:uncharacterized protein PtA15_5A92 [Puccinia triticina]WAQ84522.1 hypothetical protein PtA15_5A92 [Puccinia triticina]